MGRAGRKPESVTKDLLYFNEVVDDKRLGLWLKSALKSKENDHTTEETKAEIIYTYVQAWKFIYTIYHGKWQIFMEELVIRIPYHALYQTVHYVQSACSRKIFVTV